jgi:DNA repair exonuclease SbcCD ATPase subunit
MTVRFSMVEATMRKADDGNAMAQLLKAETRIGELTLENETLKKKNRVLLDKLRIAEETIRFKGKLQGKDNNTINAQMSGSNKPGRGSLGVPPSFAAAAAGTTAHNLQAPATPGSTRARSMSAGGRASTSRSPSAGSRRGSVGGAFERKAPESPVTSPTGNETAGIALSRPPAGRPSTAGGVPPSNAAELAIKEAEIAKRASEVASLKEQVAQLQRNLAAAQSERDAAKEQARAAVTTLSAQPQSTAIIPTGIGGVGAVSIPHADLLELERQLRDKTAHATLLKARYEHLEAKSAAERSLYDRAVTALEEQNAELRRTRSALQATEGDLQLLRSRMASVGDLEDELRRAQETIRRLEGTLTELAESPFLRADGLGGGAAGGSSSFVKDALTARQRLEQLEQSDKSLRDQVAHLQATIRGNSMEISSLQRERHDATQALDRIREENDKLRVAAEAATRSNTLLRERLALYSGGAALEGVGEFGRLISVLLIRFCLLV